MKQYRLHLFAICQMLLMMAVALSCTKPGTPNPSKPPGIALAVTSLSVDSGSKNATVIITGTGFSAITSADAVFFNGTPATVTAATTTTITTSVPNGATSGAVTVTVNNVTATGPVFTVKSVAPPPGLSISAISASSGTYGAAVIITGTGFNSTPAQNKVLFNGKTATVTAATATQLTTTVPNSATSGNITVTVNGVTANGPVFTVNIPPTLTSLSVSSGIYNSKLTIYGTNFSTNYLNDQVYINSRPADIDGLTLTSTKMTVIVPFRAGTGNIRLVVNGILVIGPVFTYKLSPVPVVTTIAGVTKLGGFNGDFLSPTGLAIDSSGNVYIADQGKARVMKIAKDSVVTQFAGSGNQGTADGQSTAATFVAPLGVAIDKAGNLYVTDIGIRKITPDGNVTTILSPPYALSAIAIDASKNLYVSYGSPNYQISKISPAGTLTAFAGSFNQGSANGTGTAASFNAAEGLAVNAYGTVFAADAFNNQVRKITAAGVVTTLAGTAAAGSANGNGAAASFNYLRGVATDAAGNIYVTDNGNRLIRKVTPAGVVSTFDWSTNTISLSTGIPQPFTFTDPAGIAVDASGNNIYISDSSAIRKITITMQ